MINLAAAISKVQAASVNHEFLQIEMHWLLTLCALVIGFLLGKRRKTIEENSGEAYIRKLLHRALNTEHFHILNNVTLPYRDGTTQVDHIVVSTSGVFVIETKDWHGWIFASPNAVKWTQVYYRLKRSMQNPLRQNHLHLMAVRSLLDFLPPENIYGAVVFTGKAEFKKGQPEGVYSPRDLLGLIQTAPSDLMSANRMAFCVGRLTCARYSLTRQTDIEHQQYLDRKFGRVD